MLGVFLLREKFRGDLIIPPASIFLKLESCQLRTQTGKFGGKYFRLIDEAIDAGFPRAFYSQFKRLPQARNHQSSLPITPPPPQVAEHWNFERAIEHCIKYIELCHRQ